MCVCVCVASRSNRIRTIKFYFLITYTAPIKLYATILNPLNKMWFIFIYAGWWKKKRERLYGLCAGNKSVLSREDLVCRRPFLYCNIWLRLLFLTRFPQKRRRSKKETGDIDSEKKDVVELYVRTAVRDGLYKRCSICPSPFRLKGSNITFLFLSHLVVGAHFGDFIFIEIQ